MSDCAVRSLDPTVAHVDPVKRRRKLFAIFLAFFACACAALVAWMDNRRQGGGRNEFGEQLYGLSASDDEVGHVTNHVLQNLLAMVEEESSHGITRSVELEQTKADAGKKPCGNECLARRKIIAAKMKALRDEINHDFKAMTDFGHKAGYLPPPQSIKQQVMAGTLLGGKGDTGANAVAPPPFDPSKVLRSKSSSHSHLPSSKTSLISTTASAPSSLPSPDAQAAVDPPPTESDASSSSSASDDSSTSSLDSSLNVDDSSLSQSSSDSSLSDHDEEHSSHSSGDSAWAKAFSFIKKTDNPVVGSSNSRTHVHNHKAKDNDPLAAAENDKFLRGFEDPRTTSLSSKHGKHGSLLDPTSPLKKGSDPLKSAESDKFLRGFLGA
uniref:Uncharacterized protein n=1 Tax=Hanusia phi TaxID=3032 RepID=A0A7S0HVV3_9CRYP|mmetsp:Transcript_36830/g.83036  ORF Transcript_36830/g.83036 Transcript_36830/m.83036 type:complete len:381 (+) Transcript_36830:336-1478(+)